MPIVKSCHHIHEACTSVLRMRFVPDETLDVDSWIDGYYDGAITELISAESLYYDNDVFSSDKYKRYKRFLDDALYHVLRVGSYRKCLMDWEEEAKQAEFMIWQAGFELYKRSSEVE